MHAQRAADVAAYAWWQGQRQLADSITTSAAGNAMAGTVRFNASALR